MYMYSTILRVYLYKYICTEHYSLLYSVAHCINYISSDDVIFVLLYVHVFCVSMMGIPKGLHCMLIHGYLFELQQLSYVTTT